MFQALQRSDAVLTSPQEGAVLALWCSPVPSFLVSFCTHNMGHPQFALPLGPRDPIVTEDSVPQMCFGEHIATLTDLNSFWSQVGVLKL